MASPVQADFQEVDQFAESDAAIGFDTRYRQLTAAEGDSHSRQLRAGSLVVTSDRFAPSVLIEGGDSEDELEAGRTWNVER